MCEGRGECLTAVFIFTGPLTQPEASSSPAERMASWISETLCGKGSMEKAVLLLRRFQAQPEQEQYVFVPFGFYCNFFVALSRRL